MNGSPVRIAAVTGGLVLAGGLLGAIAAAVGVIIATSIADTRVATIGQALMFALPGARLGAVLLPMIAWLLLRRAPLGRAFVGTALGMLLGATAGWTAALLVPDVPFTWPVAGAMIGTLIAVLLLRLQSVRSVGGDRVRVSV